MICSKGESKCGLVENRCRSGMENVITHWRTGTRGMVCVTRWEAVSTMCRIPQAGQNSKRLQENATSFLMGAVSTPQAQKPMGQNAAFQKRFELVCMDSFRLGIILELRNMMQVRWCIIEAAVRQEDSLRAHYRSYFPGCKGSDWKIYSQIQCCESERPTSTADFTNYVRGKDLPCPK